jgi:hypothetical protein
MSFFNKYKIEKKRNVKEREDSDKVVLDCIVDQIKLRDGNTPEGEYVSTKGGKKPSSWFNGSQCSPVVKGIYLIESDDGNCFNIGEDDPIDVLKEFHKNVKNGSLKDMVDDFDKRRRERDEKVLSKLKR